MRHFPHVEISRRLAEIRNDLLQVERRVEAMRESISAAEKELLDQSDQLSSYEDSLAARIVDGLVDRLGTAANSVKAARKEYLREKEVAQYMGVSVYSLRSWRSKGSKSGPPYIRVGRIVLYPVAELEKHMLKMRGISI